MLNKGWDIPAIHTLMVRALVMAAVCLQASRECRAATRETSRKAFQSLWRRIWDQKQQQAAAAGTKFTCFTEKLYLKKKVQNTDAAETSRKPFKSRGGGPAIKTSKTVAVFVLLGARWHVPVFLLLRACWPFNALARRRHPTRCNSRWVRAWWVCIRWNMLRWSWL